ncbi:hypothetical protein PMIN02_006980 [Paraphaeosphaeria minitans]
MLTRAPCGNFARMPDDPSNTPPRPSLEGPWTPTPLQEICICDQSLRCLPETISPGYATPAMALAGQYTQLYLPEPPLPSRLDCEVLTSAPLVHAVDIIYAAEREMSMWKIQCQLPWLYYK